MREEALFLSAMLLLATLKEGSGLYTLLTVEVTHPFSFPAIEIIALVCDALATRDPKAPPPGRKVTFKALSAPPDGQPPQEGHVEDNCILLFPGKDGLSISVPSRPDISLLDHAPSVALLLSVIPHLKSPKDRNLPRKTELLKRAAA